MSRRIREPIHSIIASRAETQIRSGAWAPGTRLPPERNLCDVLDVSRATLRLALAELEERGLISRHQGRGTFVTVPRIDTSVSGHFTIAAALRARGLMLTTQVLSVGIIGAGRQVATDLGILPGDEVVHLERLRSLSNVPLLLETTDLPHAIFPGLIEADFASRSLYDILLEDHGSTVQAATESLEPVFLTGRESTALEVPRRAPAMLVRRLSTDSVGRVVELSHLLLRGDRSRFLLERRVHQTWPGAPTGDVGGNEVPRSTLIAAALLADHP